MPPRRRARLRIAAVAVAVVLVVLVGGYVARYGGSGSDCTDRALVTVTGPTGSEKVPYLTDERVIERFACKGYRVVADPMGSLEMADELKDRGSRYDFGFPSSTPTASRIRESRPDATVFKTFTSPMIVVTHAPVVRTLRAAGVVRKNTEGTEIFDVATYVRVALASTRWDELPRTEVPTPQVVTLKTTDPTDSNSAAMFVSIVSNVLNDRKVVATKAQATKVLPELCQLLAAQGEKKATSEDLFESYETDGLGAVPMALLYESQARSEAPTARGTLPTDAAFLTPAPTVYSRHTFLAFNDDAAAVGRLLREDPTLRELALEHGFRPEGMQSRFGTPTDVVEPPVYEFLDTMIERLRAINQGDGECG